MIFVNVSICEKNYERTFLDNEEYKGIAEIVSFKEEKEYKNKYIIKYKNKKLIVYLEKDVELKYGDEIYFEGIFENASSNKNSNGFNYSRYLKQEKIYGILNIDKIKVIKQKQNIICKIAYLKRKLEEKLDSSFFDKESGFLKGILLGDKSYIDEDIVNDFKISNLSHILAISGMHIVYVSTGIKFLLKKFIKSKKLKNIILIFFLIFFMIFTGGTPSCMRACIMEILILISENIYRKNDFITSLLLSFDIILFYNYYNIENVGMWLSFLGTFGLVSFKIKNKFKNKILYYCFENLKTSIAVQIMIFPIMWHSYNTISFTFFISNFFVSYLIGPILILGYISMFIGEYLPILIFIENKIIKLLFFIAENIRKISISRIYIRSFGSIFIIIYYFIIYVVFLKKKYSKKLILKLLLVIAVIVIIIEYLPHNYIKMYFLDVGQGDCTFIVTENKKTILIDAGNNEGYDYGEKVVLPFLLKSGFQKLDYVIVSHFDSDHVGGLMFIIQNIKVENIIIGKQFEKSNNFEEFINIARQKNIKIIIAKAGKKIYIEKNLYFNIIWPDSQNIIRENILNNNSLVCKLNYKNISVLFTGDIEEIAEKEILKKYSEYINSTILKVAHHGSKTSSVIEFLNAVNPKYAIIQVGENNKFGHPSVSTLENLNCIKSDIYRTDENGEIVIKTDGDKIKIEKYIK